MLGGAPADPTLLERARDAGWPVRPSYGLTQACSAVALADVGDTETSGRPLPGLSISWRGRRDHRRRPVRRRRRRTPRATSASGSATGSSSAAARSTRSSPAARTSCPRRSRPRCSPTRPCARRACSAARTRSGARPSPPSSSATSTRPSCATHAATQLARFKVPKTIELVDSLPRNAAGKLLRRELS